MSDIIIKNPTTIVKEAEASGTVNINSNGTHDVKGYAYANVNVANSGNVGGGVTISKLIGNMAVVSPPGANRSLYPKSNDASGIFLKRVDNATVYLYNFNTDTTVTNNNANIDLYTLSTGVYLVWATAGRFQLGYYAMGSTTSNLTRVLYQNAYYNALIINITNNGNTGTATLYMVGTDNGTLTTTGSGEKYVATYKNVNIPAPNLATLNVNKNGTYNASDYTHNGRTVDGFNRVVVEIAENGGAGSALKTVGESLTAHSQSLSNLSVWANGGATIKRVNVDTGEILEGSILGFTHPIDGNYFVYCPTGTIIFNNDIYGDIEAGMLYVTAFGGIKYNPVTPTVQTEFPYAYTITGDYLITQFWRDAFYGGEISGIYLHTTNGETIALGYDGSNDAVTASYTNSGGSYYQAYYSDYQYEAGYLPSNQLMGVIGWTISYIEIVPGYTSSGIIPMFVQIIDNLDKIFSPYQKGQTPPGVVGEIADGTLTTLTESDLGNIDTIKQYAFAYSDNLVDITIPASVYSIGDYAFYSTDTTKKKTFRMKRGYPESAPSLGTNAINQDTIEKIIVPSGSYDVYAYDMYWGAFASYIEEEQ